MARQAVTAKQVRTPEQTAKVERRQRNKDRTDALSGKTFEQLTKNEKDTLLKVLALRAGLIQDSEDKS